MTRQTLGQRIPSKKTFGSSKKPKARSKSKPAKSARPRKTTKKLENKKITVLDSKIAKNEIVAESPVVQRYEITVESIRGDTSIGDLLVTFPRTREVLVKKGLRLEAEDAGDIYMTLDAFSAMNGIEVVTLVREIVEVAKEPLPQLSVPTLAMSSP